MKSSFRSSTRFVSNFHYAILARDQVADLKVRPGFATGRPNGNWTAAVSSSSSSSNEVRYISDRLRPSKRRRLGSFIDWRERC